jgi:hypothetical protein
MTEIDANELRAALLARSRAAMNEGHEATDRAVQAIKAMDQAAPNTVKRADAMAAFDKADREINAAVNRANGLQDAIDLIDEMTRLCDQCGCPPQSCGCVFN